MAAALGGAAALALIVAAAVTSGLAPALLPTEGGAISGESASGDVVPAVFDQTVTYDDGLQLQVTEPVPFTPSPGATGAGAGADFVVTITVYNGTAEAFLPAWASSVTVDGVPLASVIDPASGILDSPPSEQIPLGQTVSYRAGFALPVGVDEPTVQYDISPSPEHLAARFTR